MILLVGGAGAVVCCVEVDNGFCVFEGLFYEVFDFGVEGLVEAYVCGAVGEEEEVVCCVLVVEGEFLVGMFNNFASQCPTFTILSLGGWNCEKRDFCLLVFAVSASALLIALL